jgi:hypothetical protein
MEIPHLTNPKRSRFYPLVRAALPNLSKTGTATIDLRADGGYTGECQVDIRNAAESSFEADVELRDWTRFPARVRAACTALRDAGLSGTFRLTHDNGTLTITRA